MKKQPEYDPVSEFKIKINENNKMIKMYKRKSQKVTKEQVISSGDLLEYLFDNLITEGVNIGDNDRKHYNNIIMFVRNMKE